MSEQRGTSTAPPQAADPIELGTEAERRSIRATRASREPAIELIAGLADDLTRLVRAEAELVRAEVAEKLEQARSSMTSFGAGALVAYAGLILLLIALALGIDVWIQRPWLSMLIVGAVAAAAGAAMLARGRHGLSADALTPRRSARSLHKDAELLRETSRKV